MKTKIIILILTICYGNISCTKPTKSIETNHEIRFDTISNITYFHICWGLESFVSKD